MYILPSLFLPFLQDGSSAKEGEAGVAGEESGAPKSGDSMDADATAAPPAEAVPVDGAPSKTAAAAADVPETPTPMETDDVEQLE